VNLHIDCVAHLQISEVPSNKTKENLFWLFIKLHDDAINASKEPDIEKYVSYLELHSTRAGQPIVFMSLITNSPIDQGGWHSRQQAATLHHPDL
jgi:hypothetical protein